MNILRADIGELRAALATTRPMVAAEPQPHEDPADVFAAIRYADHLVSCLNQRQRALG